MAKVEPTIEASTVDREDENLKIAILDHFGFKEEPFSNSPNPRFLYLTDHHRTIINKLMHAIVSRQGLSLVMGDVGSGKTTLARHLYDIYRDSPRNVAVFMTNPKFSSEMQLLKAISAEFEVESKRSKLEQIHEIQKALIKHLSDEKNVLLIIDEAQLMIGPQFELVRQFLNFETNDRKLLQIVLFAQMEIKAKLRQKKAVQSRIVTQSNLDSFDFKTLKEMISFRCTVAGQKNKEIFTEDAYKAIYDYSKGIPRDAIQLCYNATPYGMLNDMQLIDSSIISYAYEHDIFKKNL